VLVGCVFFLAAVAPGDESAGYRRQLAAAGKDLIENYRAYAHTDPEGLRLGHVAQVVVGDLMGENGHELLVTRLAKQAGLAHPGADGVLSGLQRRAHVLLGPVQCTRGLFLHGLELLHGFVTNVPGFVVGVCAKIFAPEPHGETPGDRAHDEIDHRRPPVFVS
jgi:hypothetical protein